MVDTTKEPGQVYPNGSAVAKADVILFETEIKAVLARSSRKRGTVANGTSLNSVREPGFYFLSANGGYTGTPSDYDDTASYHLIVAAQGNPVGNGDTRYVHQQIVSIAVFDSGRRYIRQRTFDRDNPANPNNVWAGMARLDADIFAQRGTLPFDADLNDIRNPGTYTIQAGSMLAHAPSLDPTQAYHLTVEGQGNAAGNGDSRFPRQIIRQFNGNAGPRQWFERVFDRDGDSADPRWQWLPVGGGGSASARFAGKTIVVLGDSIAEGSPSLNWPALLAARYPGATVINAGFGGCRMAEHTGASVSALYDPMSMYRISERIANGDWSVLTAAAQALYEAEGDDNRQQAAALAGLDWTKDIILVIAYGTNDFRGTGGVGVPIGTDADMTGATFKGAINLSISNILTAYPQVKIMLMTPLWRSRVDASGDDSNVTPNGSGVFLRDYAEAIKDRAAPCQLPVADLHAQSGINILNWPTYMPDGLHPNTAPGAQRVADFAGAQLEALF